jgi:2-hydroxychromene-2-carboxylate isomerase
MSSPSLIVRHYSDPGCPWAYSASPALAVLRWRYGDQLAWRLVLIGLTEQAEQYTRRGYTPLRSAQGHLRFRRYGMPFAPQPRARVVATGRACRAIVAVRRRHPVRELATFRAFQFAWFTTPLLLDEDSALHTVLSGVAGVDADAILTDLDDPAVEEAYQRDRGDARTAAGGATEFQGKAAATDGPVRFTAPSVVFEGAGGRLEAGGFQPVEAYDVLIANLDRTLARSAPPEDPAGALGRFPDGLTTQELAAVMARGNDPPDRRSTEAALLSAVVEHRAVRHALGDDALWAPGPALRGEGVREETTAGGVAPTP